MRNKCNIDLQFGTPNKIIQQNLKPGLHLNENMNEACRSEAK